MKIEFANIWSKTGKNGMTKKTWPLHEVASPVIVRFKIGILGNTLTANCYLNPLIQICI